MKIKPSKESLDTVIEISKVVPTFHHHYHILYDIAITMYKANKTINYVEIGAYAGASSCLMLKIPNCNVVSIDLGTPINKVDVLENIIQFKNNNNYYKYIQGNSQLEETKQELLKVISNIDILFIDGDHSYNGALADFNLYAPLVNVGGYIVFDDYRDDVHSPDVRVMVNDLVSNITEEFEIIGTYSNELGAHPSDLKEGNCFVIKKVK